MALCLVTGACGFMGTHMVEVLTAAGHQVRATDLKASYDQDDWQVGRFPSVLKKLNVEFLPSDVTHKESMRPLLQGVEYAFHIAAIFNYAIPWQTLYRVNVQGTQSLLELISETSGANCPSFKKLVLWGAGGIYDFSGSTNRSFVIDESSPKKPTNNYLQSKWEQEQLVASFCRSKGIRFSVIRPTTVYGPRAIYGGGQLITDALKMKKLMVPKNFTFKIPTIHVRDVCRSALHLAMTDATDGEAYNVNDDSVTPTVEYMRMMAEITGRHFRLLPPVPVGLVAWILKAVAIVGAWRKKIFGGKPPKFAKDMIKLFGLDISYQNDKLKQTGFQFEYPQFEKGLRETVKWYLTEFKGGSSNIHH